jgi:hypothetical protein
MFLYKIKIYYTLFITQILVILINEKSDLNQVFQKPNL